MFKSKTMLFAAILALLGSLQATLPEFQALFTEQVYGYTTMGIAAVVAVLRVVTTESLAEKSRKQ